MDWKYLKKDSLAVHILQIMLKESLRLIKIGFFSKSKI